MSVARSIGDSFGNLGLVAANIVLAVAPRRECALDVQQRDDVIDKLECHQRRANRCLAEYVAGQHRQQRILNAQSILRSHEQVAHGRIGDAINKPRKLFWAGAHHLVEPFQCLGRFSWPAQAGVDRIGADKRTIHCQQYAG